MCHLHYNDEDYTYYPVECASWMGWCDYSWLCGTTYDRDTDEARPPPSCPMPPPGHHPPVQPGTCRFNTSVGHCNFTRYTSKHHAVQSLKSLCMFAMGVN